MAEHHSTDNPVERWASIPGYEGFYEVSNLGRARGVDRIDARGRRWPGRILSPGMDRYASIGLWRDGKPKTVYIHSTVLLAFVGPRPEGMDACHNDGDATNNRLDNLRWDTVSENRLDTVRHGTHRYSKRTECLRGHALVEANLVLSYKTKGVRRCKACERARSDARRAGGRRASQEAADAHYKRIMLER